MKKAAIQVSCIYLRYHFVGALRGAKASVYHTNSHRPTRPALGRHYRGVDCLEVAARSPANSFKWLGKCDKVSAHTPNPVQGNQTSVMNVNGERGLPGACVRSFRQRGLKNGPIPVRGAFRPWARKVGGSSFRLARPQCDHMRPNSSFGSEAGTPELTMNRKYGAERENNAPWIRV